MIIHWNALFGRSSDVFFEMITVDNMKFRSAAAATASTFRASIAAIISIGWSIWAAASPIRNVTTQTVVDFARTTFHCPPLSAPILRRCHWANIPKIRWRMKNCCDILSNGRSSTGVFEGMFEWFGWMLNAKVGYYNRCKSACSVILYFTLNVRSNRRYIADCLFMVTTKFCELL